MVLYLTDKTTSEVITQAYNAGVVAVKLYPVGATTNSDGGIVTIIQKMLWGNRRCDIITTLTHKIYCIFSGDIKNLAVVVRVCFLRHMLLSSTRKHSTKRVQ
jgi:hypothetical protein